MRRPLHGDGLVVTTLATIAILATSLCAAPAFRIETQRRPVPVLDQIQRRHSMLDIWFCGLGLGVIGLMLAYVALLRKA